MPKVEFYTLGKVLKLLKIFSITIKKYKLGSKYKLILVQTDIPNLSPKITCDDYSL